MQKLLILSLSEFRLLTFLVRLSYAIILLGGLILDIALIALMLGY